MTWIALAWTMSGCWGGAPSEPLPEPTPCAALDAPACMARAQALEEAGDEPAAVLLYEEACVRLDHVAACAPATTLLLNGAAARGAKAAGEDLSGERSPFGRALGTLKRSCVAGEGEACHQLGMYAVQGKGVPKNLDDAKAQFTAGCSAQHAQSCLDAGLIAVQLGGMQDWAAEQFALSCTLGSPQGCARHGVALAQGLADAPDVQGALAAYEQACAMGFPAGCGLAAMTAEGDASHPPQPERRRSNLVAGALLGDWVAAEAWLTLPGEPRPGEVQALQAGSSAGCEAGEGKACHVLGVLAPVTGATVAEQAAWFTTACADGERVACGRLTDLVHRELIPGDTVGKLSDLDAAACVEGWAPACVWYGHALEDGGEVNGVDLPGAARAYASACAKGDARGCAARDRLAETTSNTPVDTPSQAH